MLSQHLYILRSIPRMMHSCKMSGSPNKCYGNFSAVEY